VCELSKQQKKRRHRSLSLKLPELFGGDGLISKEMEDDNSLEVVEDVSPPVDDLLKEESNDILIFRPWWERFFQILAIILWTSFLIIQIYLAFVPNFGVAYSLGIFPLRVDVIILLGILTIVGVTNLTVLEYKTQWLTYMAFSGVEGVRTLDLEDIFQNYNRIMILELILNQPYLHFSEIQRITELKHGNLQYHINVFLDAKIIKKKEVGQLSIYFPYLKKNIFETINLKIMKSESTLQIYHCINQNPGITMSEISQTLNKHKCTISYHVQKLVENKIVREEKHGRKKKLFLERDIFLNEP
jgi:predicted transcriptional regulator